MQSHSQSIHTIRSNIARLLLQPSSRIGIPSIHPVPIPIVNRFVKHLKLFVLRAKRVIELIAVRLRSCEVVDTFALSLEAIAYF